MQEKLKITVVLGLFFQSCFEYREPEKLLIFLVGGVFFPSGKKALHCLKPKSCLETNYPPLLPQFFSLQPIT